MLNSSLGAVLVSSLASTVLDKDTILKAINLLIDSASIFLQVRREKRLGNSQAPYGEKPTSEEDKRVMDIRSRINPALDDLQLEYAERELESLFVQLRNHHRMLAIKQEQKTQFAEFLPPYMELAIRNEQRAIVETLERIRAIMELVLNLEFPDIEVLSHIVENDTIM